MKVAFKERISLAILLMLSIAGAPAGAKCPYGAGTGGNTYVPPLHQWVLEDPKPWRELSKEQYVTACYGICPEEVNKIKKAWVPNNKTASYTYNGTAWIEQEFDRSTNPVFVLSILSVLIG